MNKEFITQTVRGNTKIIDSNDNWNLLLYKQVYHIKRSTPSLNIGLKASRELCLNRVFSHDVTAAMLVSQNNETAAMLVSQTNPVGVELFSYVKTSFCSNKFAWLLAMCVKTLYSLDSIVFVLYFHVHINANVPSCSILISATCLSPQAEDDIELYRNITSTSTSSTLCICCLYYRHNAFTRYHIYSLSVKIISR